MKISIPIAAAILLSATPAFSVPLQGFVTANTPYGAFGCRQRAESKLFSVGATRINSPAGSTVTWADLNSFSIGVWCRGNEAVIMVAGDRDTTDLLNDIRSAF